MRRTFIHQINLRLRAVRPILRIYTPLALAYQMMVIEAPLLTAMIAGMPNATAQLRAWGLTMQLVHIVFAPIVMLLATSLAFVKSQATYTAARRMTMMLGVGCTLAMLLLAWTPTLDIIGNQILGYPVESVHRARLPLRIMLLWPAAIGWRRFSQGILIHAGMSHRMLHGTLMRLVIIGVCSIPIRNLDLPGAAAAALIFTIGVVSEAIFITLLATKPTQQLPLLASDPNANALLKAVSRLHLPLALTGFLGLVIQPVLSRYLASNVDSATTLAVWPMLFSLITGIRGWGICMQELAVTALRKRILRETGSWKVATFIGLIAIVGTALVCISPTLTNALDVILNLRGGDVGIRNLLHSALPWTLLLPLTAAWLSVHRGILAFRHQSLNISIGMSASVIALPVCIALSSRFSIPPLCVACIVLTLVDGISIAAQAIPLSHLASRIVR